MQEHPTTKQCRGCGQTKPLADFKNYNNGRGPRKRGKCQECRATYDRFVRINGKPPARPTVTEKRCIDCKTIKPIDDFAWQNSSVNQRRYRGSVCRPCRAKRCRDWLNVPGNKDRARSSQLSRRFGISVEEYERLLASQNGGCAICRKQPTNNIDHRTKKPRRLAIDHNHETGIIRGLLCAACNRALGNFQDDRNLLLAAIDYLDKNTKA